MTVLHGPALNDAFNRACGNYDRLTALSPGYHRQLASAAALLGPAGATPRRILDLGCGTGASTLAVTTADPGAVVTAADASAGMLEHARAKPWPPRVEFVEARAEDLGRPPVQGPYDAVLAAYLLRNTADPDHVLDRIRQVLRPGGPLVVHDYTLRGRTIDRALWNALCWGIVIPLGTVGAGGPTLYRHLRRSVLGFDTAHALAARIERAGFTDVRVHPATGWQAGVVHTLTAVRPPEHP
ncbi:class I SAM-dependent methyltransferase [Streptomyces sp. BE303]|uniref:class I SAM-dependent methyltransferase n=1 Tax=Streptomyces sp. BE303 TaxID=3002528 RepID=UPI002E76D340|nr:class I SAM-dependent methyltransferase [Streptomyces sp. BE303]MED7948646.1 class I SAM-dependent methyltransferase [Streptomyces sp. BE303]